MGKIKDVEIAEYVRKFGSASRFVQKIIDSFDCPFAIVDVDTCEIKVTNAVNFFPGMKCRELFKCAGDNCGQEKCPIKKVVVSKAPLITRCNDLGVSLEIHVHPIFDPSGEVASVIIYGFDVTQSQALVESEEKFKEAFQHNTAVMSITAIEDNRFLEVNDKFLELLGYKREEVIGKTSSEISLVRDKKDENYLINEMKKNGKIKNYELSVLDKKGEVVIGLFSAETIRVGGRPYYLTVFEDISERKKAEAKLRESEEKFKVLAEQSLLGIVVLQDDKIKYANEAVAKLSGYSVKEMLGWGSGEFFRVLSPEKKKFVSNRAMRKQKGIEEEAVSSYVREIIAKDNTKKWIEQYSRIVDYKGRPANLVTFVDITERKKAEEKLKEIEETHVKEIEDRFYSILQNSQDLVYRYDFRKNCFDYVSESVFTILGYPLEEFIKMDRDDYSQRIHPDDVGVFESMGDSSEEESVSAVEYRFKKKGGDYIWLEVQRVFFRDKGGRLVYSIEDIRDVSKGKLDEEEKAKLEERLIQIRNKDLEKRERVSLTDREKLVLWGFCRYPLLNDEELANKLELKRSTLTAIKNRLKGDWFNINYIPNFYKLGCQFFAILNASFKSGHPKSLDLVKKTPGVVLSNYQEDQLLVGFTSDKYVDFKRFMEQIVEDDALKRGLSENSFFYGLDDVFLYDISGLVNSLFGLKRKEKPVVYKFDNGATELSINEKRVLHAIVKDPEMSSAEIAKKIWTSKPTVIKVKKKLLEENYIYPYVVPDLRKIGFPYVARLSFEFDSDLSAIIDKEPHDVRVILRIVGKRKMIKIILFASKEEYEEEIDMIKNSYHKKGIDFRLDSEIFSIQKRRSKGSKMESFIGDKLFGEEI